MQLADLHIIVTGAGGGLGRSFVAALLAAGARVAAGDTNTAALRALRGSVADLPGHLHVARLDVTDEASVSTFVAEAEAALGGLNGLINSAGILRDGLLVQRRDGAVTALTLAQWRKVLDVNLTGPFLMSREVAATMLRRGTQPAVIVNISSLSRHGNPGQSSYAASKAGLDAATRTWALELAPHGIRVGAVAPGVTTTGFLDGVADEALQSLLGAIPVGRAGEPEEIWMAVKLIIECDYFNGRVIEVDGGGSMV